MGTYFLNLTACLSGVLGWEKGLAKAISNGSDKCFFHSKFLSSTELGWTLQLINSDIHRTERPVWGCLSFVTTSPVRLHGLLTVIALPTRRPLRKLCKRGHEEGFLMPQQHSYTATEAHKKGVPFVFMGCPLFESLIIVLVKPFWLKICYQKTQLLFMRSLKQREWHFYLFLIAYFQHPRAALSLCVQSQDFIK